jgi:hypothetical protein
MNYLVTIPLENVTKFHETDSNIYQYIYNYNAFCYPGKKLESDLTWTGIV